MTWFGIFLAVIVLLAVIRAVTQITLFLAKIGFAIVCIGLAIGAIAVFALFEKANAPKFDEQPPAFYSATAYSPQESPLVPEKPIGRNGLSTAIWILLPIALVGGGAFLYFKKHRWPAWLKQNPRIVPGGALPETVSHPLPDAVLKGVMDGVPVEFHLSAELWREAGDCILIGRDHHINHITLSSPDISRQHLHLRREGEVVYIAHRGAKNRVLINHIALQEPFSEKELRFGDHISLGDIRLEYCKGTR